MPFKGIITPLITPFARGGEVDWRAWRQVIEFQIAQGVHGIIAGGTTGEYYALSDDERVAQFREAKAVARGRIPVFGGVGALRGEQSVGMAKAAREAGLDGILLPAPPYSLPAADELAAHCMRVGRAAGLPVMLYNFPARTGADMNPDFLRRIVREKNFRAIKESSGGIERLHLLAREFSSISLSCGADDQALEFFAWGAESWVCAAANGLPQEVVALYEACAVRGDFALGRKIMSALLPMMTLLENGGKFIQCVKCLCELAGVPGGNPRLPLRPMSARLRRDTEKTAATLKAEMTKIKGSQARKKSAAR